MVSDPTQGQFNLPVELTYPSHSHFGKKRVKHWECRDCHDEQRLRARLPANAVVF